jgi:hypothetical protein
VGLNSIPSTISNSYSTGSVSGIDDVGGLVGMNNNSFVNNSYSTGTVSGTGSNVGGLVGNNNNATTTNSFWDTETSGITTSNGGTGKTTAEMTTTSTFTNVGWDFVGESANGSNDYWKMNVCISAYPVLSWQTPKTPSTGTGTIADPYQIATLEDLRALSENSCIWDSCFIQTANINATVTNTWNNGAGFSPIGNDPINFTGSYNGSGYIIDSLFINRPTTSYIGLFGYTNGSTIDSLGLSNVDITGAANVGGLVGATAYSSTVNNSYSTGSVSGTGDYVGGLVGSSFLSTVSNSYSTGSVLGTNSIGIGGLVGRNFNNSTVSNSYSTGSVTGTNDLGGLVGNNNSSSSVSNSYSTGTVSGNDRVGGLVGKNYVSSSISNSYSTGSVSGTGSDVGGLMGDNNSSTVTNSFWNTDIYPTDNGIGTGKTTAEMQDLCTYLYVGWDFAVETSNGSDNYWGINDTENGSYPFLAWQGYIHTGVCCSWENTTPTNTVNTDVCYNSTYTYADGTEHTNITENEAYVSTLVGQAANTCDSIVTENITVLPIAYNTVDADICSDGSYTYADGTEHTNITADEAYVSTLVGQAANTCDSIVTENITVLIVDISVTENGITLTANITSANYQWIDCNDNNNPIISETNQSFTATVDGSYAVIIDDGTCIDTSICYIITGVGINELNNTSINIFPNPSSGNILVEGKNIKSIRITDTNGKIIQQLAVTDKIINIDLSKEAKGIYFVNVSTEKEVVIKKIVIE